MKGYTVTGKSVTLAAGEVVGMTSKQAQRRRLNVEKLEDGLYKVLNPIQFKNGEEFKYSGQLNTKLGDVNDLSAAKLKELNGKLEKDLADTKAALLKAEAELKDLKEKEEAEEAEEAEPRKTLGLNKSKGKGPSILK